MDELLKELLNSEVLTEETQQQISEAFQQHIQSVTEEAEQKAETRIRAELTEQFVEERNLLIEAVDAKVMEMLDGEVNELKEDIDRFRDLEAEYAAKLVEKQEVMSEQLKQDMATLLQTLDNYLEERLEVEFDELKEDIEVVKKVQFGQEIFEAFSNKYMVSFVDEDSLQAKLQEATDRLAEVEAQLTESKGENSTLIRESRLNTLLAPLDGRNREVMETILATTDTDKLEETYNTFVDRVISESVNPKTEKENDEVLAEGDEQKPAEEGDVKDLSEEVIIKDGNRDETIVESASEGKPQLSEAERQSLRRLSGQF